VPMNIGDAQETHKVATSTPRTRRVTADVRSPQRGSLPRRENPPVPGRAMLGS
jgi:hypothetical protein